MREFLFLGGVMVQTVQIAQMATLDADQLRILLPTEESFPRWITFTDFEKVTAPSWSTFYY
jgi:hypothetical protein